MSLNYSIINYYYCTIFEPGGHRENNGTFHVVVELDWFPKPYNYIIITFKTTNTVDYDVTKNIGLL